MKSFLILIITTLFSFLTTALFSQRSLLQSGPMLGYSEIREVALWIQTNKSANVRIKYTNKDNQTDSYWTNQIQTKKETAFTAKLLADSVEPGNSYIYINYILMMLKLNFLI